MRYTPVAGVRLEFLGDYWAAFSPLSGETHLLNVESAVIMEWLLEHAGATAGEVAHALAGDAGLAARHLEVRIDLAWGPLLDAGLVRRCQLGPEGTGH